MASGRMREPLERLEAQPYVNPDSHHILWWRDYADYERKELAQRAKHEGWPMNRRKKERADLEAALGEALNDTLYRQRLVGALKARNESVAQVREARSGGVAGKLRRWGASHVVRKRLSRFRKAWLRMLARAENAPLKLPSRRQLLRRRKQ